MKTYKDELIKSMNYLAEKPNTIFVGQQTAFAGNPMSTTILDISKDIIREVLKSKNPDICINYDLGIF